MDLANLIERVVRQTREDLLSGSAISVTGNAADVTAVAVRVRKLPLVVIPE